MLRSTRRTLDPRTTFVRPFPSLMVMLSPSIATTVKRPG